MTDGTYRLPGLTDSVHLPSPERYWDDPMLVGEDDAYNNSSNMKPRQHPDRELTHVSRVYTSCSGNHLDR